MARSAEQRLESWLSGTVPEGQRLDFKQTVHLTTKTQRLELLKDLTAMGNGGGGTIVVGVAERKVDDLSVADSIDPLEDRSLSNRMADLILDSVQPTLAWHETIVDVDGGYVLIIDVEPSPLGPYMVQFAGEHRYHRRIGEKSRPMPEAMVRDLYAAAANWTRDRQQLWATMHLPLSSHWGDHPLLTITGVPVDTNDQLFDPSIVTISDLEPEAEMHYVAHHAQLAGVPGLIGDFRVWADGFHAEADGLISSRNKLPPASQTRARIYRNGSIGVGAHIATEDRLDPVRMANALLTYLATLWASRGVRSVELLIELTGFERRAGSAPPLYPAADHPSGAPPIAARVGEVISVDQVVRAESRHALLQVFANRVANAFGDRSITTGWTRGLLRSANEATRLIAAGGDIVDLNSGATTWLVAENGSVRHPANTKARAAWWIDGALLDLDGNLLAVTEFPTIANLPADFMVGHPDATYADDLPDRKREALTGLPGALEPGEPPRCTGQWSTLDAVQYMRTQRDGE